MSDEDNPLNHLPDPNKRFKVLAYTRGAEICVEILDDVTKTGVVMPFLDALIAVADVNLELARVGEIVAKQMQGGTLPEWERQITEWGAHGEGSAEHN